MSTNPKLVVCPQCARIKVPKKTGGKFEIVWIPKPNFMKLMRLSEDGYKKLRRYAGIKNEYCDDCFEKTLTSAGYGAVQEIQVQPFSD